jgi:hypothetical protein
MPHVYPDQAGVRKPGGGRRSDPLPALWAALTADPAVIDLRVGCGFGG